MPQTNAVPIGEPVIRTVAMPADTNPAGDIFGGWLMAQMDLAAGSAAARRARGRCATVAADSMVFHSPVFVGDEVSLYADIVRVGRTSLSIRIEAWRRSRDGDDCFKVTEATFTFVAIDDQRRPRPVPAASS
jgi:acyl-CoA thioesterase YciA